MKKGVFWPLLFIGLVAFADTDDTAPPDDITVTLKGPDGKPVRGTVNPSSRLPAGNDPIPNSPPASEKAASVSLPRPQPLPPGQTCIQDVPILPREPEKPRMPSPISGSRALKWMKKGALRFNRGNFRKDLLTPKDLRRLSKQAQPHAVVFAPSDARLSPELLFDQKLGEIITVRTYDLIIDQAVTASIENAVIDQGLNLLIILSMTGKTDPKTNNATQEPPPTARQRLMARSPKIHSLAKLGHIKVIEAFYRVDLGTVEFKEN